MAIAETPRIPERVDYWLSTWATWMRSEPNRLGYPHHCTVVKSGGEDRRMDSWLEDEGQSMRIRNCEAMNALIDSLPPSQCAAVRHIYAGDVWRFPRDNMYDLIERAANTLLIGMNARAIL